MAIKRPHRSSAVSGSTGYEREHVELGCSVPSPTCGNQLHVDDYSDCVLERAESDLPDFPSASESTTTSTPTPWASTRAHWAPAQATKRTSGSPLFTISVLLKHQLFAGRRHWWLPHRHYPTRHTIGRNTLQRSKATTPSRSAGSTRTRTRRHDVTGRAPTSIFTTMGLRIAQLEVSAQPGGRRKSKRSRRCP